MPPPLRHALRLLRCQINRVLGGPAMNRLAKTGDAPIPVFFYHRIANSDLNSWSMTCEQFASQVDQIRNRYEIISLDEIQRRIRLRQSFAPAAGITFDDGYAENSNFALPLLSKFNIPCTYFVSVDNVRFGKPFPHDLLAGKPLAANPIEDLKHWADCGIEIGLHTRTHYDFSTPHDDAIIEREITTAKTELETWIGRPIRYFAFPYGLPQHLSERVIAAVGRLGMNGFCSAFGAYNVPGRDDFHIRRIHADVESERFNNWLYFDKQKLKQEPRIEYSLAPESNHKIREEASQCGSV